MKNNIKIVLGMCALMLGLSVTASAQVTKHRTRDGRIVYQTTQRRDDRRYERRDERRYDRRWDNRRDNRRYDDRDDYRWNNGRYNQGNNGRYNQDWRRQTEGQVSNKRTYRLPNGRLVTILPDGRRIYH